jgi:hypothetical protein
VMWLARERSLHVVNVDSTILLEHRGCSRYRHGVCECEGKDG